MELDHAGQILGAETRAVVPHQFCRKCRQNLLAVLGPLIIQHLAPDALADAPIQHR